MDETKKALLSIELDTAALTQNAEKAKETVKTLTEQLKELKTAGKEAGEGFDKVVEQLKKASEEAKKATDALKEYGKGLKDSAKDANDLKKSIDDLQKNQNDLNKSQANTDSLKTAEDAQKKLEKAVTATNKLLEDSNKKYKNADKDGKNKQIEELIIAYNKLSVAERENEKIGGALEDRITTLRAKQKELSVDKDKLNKEIESGNQIFKNHKELLDSSTNSIANTKAAILILTKEYFNLSKEQRHNADIGGVLNQKIDELQKNLQKLDSKPILAFTDKIVDAGKKVLPFSQGIGKAAEGFKTLKEGSENAIKGIADIGKSFSEYITQVKTLSAEQNNLKGNSSTFRRSLQTLGSGIELATGGVKNFSKALIGTGIGAIIVAVGLLTDYFKKFQPVVDLVEQVMAGFNGALAAGKHILDEFFASIHSIGDFFSKIGGILRHPIDGFKDLANTMANAAQKTFELKKAQQELDKDALAASARTSERQTEIARLRSVMATASVEERKKIAKQIKDIQDAEFNDDQNRGQKQVKITLDKVNAINKLNKDEAFNIKNLTEAKIEALEKTRHLDAETVKSLREALKQTDDLRTKGYERIIKNSQEHQTKQTGAEQKHGQNLEVIRQSQDRINLAGIKNSQKRELAELEISFNEQTKEYKKNTAVFLQLAKERDQKKKEIEQKYSDEAKAKKMADDKALYDADIELQLFKAQGDFEKLKQLKLEQNQKNRDFDLENDKLSQQEKETLAKKAEKRELEILQEYSEAKKSFLEKQIEEDRKLAEGEKDPKKQKDAQLKVLEDEYNLKVLLAKGNTEKLKQIELDHQRDIAKIESSSVKSKKGIIEEESALITKKAKNYADHFSKLAGLFGKNTQISKAAFQAQKAIAVAEIAINTEKQVSASISATKNQIVTDSKFGFPLGTILVAKDIALGVIDVATTIAGGAKQIATINSTNVQGLARGGLYLSDSYGGMVKGPGTGASDSINARLSNGESVINARSTEMFAPILSAINQAGGGRAFNTSQGNGYALGGIFSGSNTFNDSSNDLANTRALNEMAKTMAANMPRQILVVEDVQASLQNKAMLQSMSNF